MIEDLYDSVRRIIKSIPDCYMSGEVLNIEGVKRVSSDMIKELFEWLNNEYLLISNYLYIN